MRIELSRAELVQRLKSAVEREDLVLAMQFLAVMAAEWTRAELGAVQAAEIAAIGGKAADELKQRQKSPQLLTISQN